MLQIANTPCSQIVSYFAYKLTFKLIDILKNFFIICLDIKS
jgi:hypothetical protein